MQQLLQTINKGKYQIYKIQPVFQLLFSQQEWSQKISKMTAKVKETSWNRNMKDNFLPKYFHNCTFLEGAFLSGFLSVSLSLWGQFCKPVARI